MARTKGSLNRTTIQAKEIINNILTDCLDNVKADILNLDAKDRLKVILDLLPYLLAKEKASQVLTFENLNSTQLDQVIQDLMK